MVSNIGNMAFNFLLFIRTTYGMYLPMLICLSLIETILVTLNHAILGHGLQFTWLYGSKPSLMTDEEIEKKKGIGLHEVRKYE